VDEAKRGIVVIGDVVNSQRDLAGASAWSRKLSGQLNEAYPDDTLAAFDFAQGDEIQGLLREAADPFRVVLDAFLAPGGPRMRWAVAAGAVESGSGSAIRRTGEAFVVARELIGQAKDRRDLLLARTGEPDADRLLDQLAPVLASVIVAMTRRQREIARRSLLEGLRQTDVAERLGVARATISVAYARGRIRDAARLLDAVGLIFRDGLARRDKG
jgi:predicted DNA-binding protein (UPF0251 family)